VPPALSELIRSNPYDPYSRAVPAKIPRNPESSTPE
jgi:hypothetical protein